MNTIDSAIIPKFFLPEENEGRFTNQTVCDSLKGCLAFGSTAKNYHTLINSLSFCQSLISSIGFQKLLLDPCNLITQSEGLLARQFRQLTQWIKNMPVEKNEEFTGAVFGDAYGSQAGIEVFSFIEEKNSISRFLLKDHSSSSSIKIPENIVVAPKKIYKNSAYVARSHDFIVSNRRGDSAVFCFSNDGEFQKHYEVKEEILGLTIREDSLYIREWMADKREKISIADLKSSATDLLEVSIPQDVLISSLNCVFGETYLVLNSKNQLFATSLASLTKQQIVENGTPVNWIKESVSYSFNCILPDGQDFIGITMVTKNAEIQIVKIKILEKGFEMKILATCVAPIDGLLVAAHLHLNRLFFAFENVKTSSLVTQIYSYDLETKIVNQLLSSPTYSSNFPFRPRFLCSTASKVHYLLMGLPLRLDASPGYCYIKSHLTTFDYELTPSIAL